MTKYSDIMIDLETLSVLPNATILSISAIAFNPFDITPDLVNYPTFDVLISLEGQENRHVQEETINWWARQHEDVRAKIFSETGRISLKEALEQLTPFVWNKDRIWAQGVTLDITVLDEAFREYNLPTPWPYHIVRDSRTLLDLCTVEQPPVTHDSLQDCFRQISGVQQVIHKLGVTRFARFK